MDMQLPHALLEVTESPSSYRSTERPEFFFSDQLCAHYDPQTRAIWSRWSPRPRPSFNPGLLKGLSAYCRFVEETEASIECLGESMPVEYTVLASSVPGVFNLGGDLDLFTRLIETADAAGLAQYGTACVDVLYRKLRRTWSADFDHLARARRMPRRRFRGGAVERHYSRRATRTFRLPGNPVQSVSRNGRVLVPRPQGGTPRDRGALSTGKLYSADDMLALGVVDCVVDTGQGESAVASLVNETAAAVMGWSASPALGAV